MSSPEQFTPKKPQSEVREPAPSFVSFRKRARRQVDVWTTEEALSAHELRGIEETLAHIERGDDLTVDEIGDLINEVKETLKLPALPPQLREQLYTAQAKLVAAQEDAPLRKPASIDAPLLDAVGTAGVSVSRRGTSVSGVTVSPTKKSEQSSPTPQVGSFRDLVAEMNTINKEDQENPLEEPSTSEEIPAMPPEVEKVLNPAFNTFIARLNEGKHFGEAVQPLMQVARRHEIEIDLSALEEISEDIADIRILSERISEENRPSLIQDVLMTQEKPTESHPHPTTQDELRTILKRIEERAQKVTITRKLKGKNALWALNPTLEAGTTWLEVATNSAMAIAVAKVLTGSTIAAFSPGHFALFAAGMATMGVPNMMTKNYLQSIVYDPRNLYTDRHGKKGVMIAMRKNALPAVGLGWLGVSTYLAAGFIQSIGAETQTAREVASSLRPPIEAFSAAFEEKKNFVPNYAKVATAIEKYFVDMEQGKESGTGEYTNWTAAERTTARENLTKELVAAGLTESEAQMLKVDVSGKAGRGPNTWLILSVLRAIDAEVEEKYKKSPKLSANRKIAPSVRKAAGMKEGETHGEAIVRILNSFLEVPQIAEMLQRGEEAKAISDDIEAAAQNAMNVMVSFFLYGVPPANTIDLELKLQQMFALETSITQAEEQQLQVPVAQYREALRGIGLDLPAMDALNMRDVLKPLRTLADILKRIREQRDARAAKSDSTSNAHKNSFERAQEYFERFFMLDITGASSKSKLAAEFIGDMLAGSFAQNPKDEKERAEWIAYAQQNQVMMIVLTTLFIQFFVKLLFFVPTAVRGSTVRRREDGALTHMRENDLPAFVSEVTRSFNNELSKIIPDFVPMDESTLQAALLSVGEQVFPDLREVQKLHDPVVGTIKGLGSYGPETQTERELESLYTLLERMQNESGGAPKFMQKLMETLAPGITINMRNHAAMIGVASKGSPVSERQRRVAERASKRREQSACLMSEGHYAFRIGVLRAEILALQKYAPEVERPVVDTYNILAGGPINQGDVKTIGSLAKYNELISTREEQIAHFEKLTRTYHDKRVAKDAENIVTGKDFSITVPPERDARVGFSATAGVERTARALIEQSQTEVSPLVDAETRLSLIAPRARRLISSFKHQYPDYDISFFHTTNGDNAGVLSSFEIKVMDNAGTTLYSASLPDTLLGSDVVTDQYVADEVERWIRRSVEIQTPPVIRMSIFSKRFFSERDGARDEKKTLAPIPLSGGSTRPEEVSTSIRMLSREIEDRFAREFAMKTKGLLTTFDDYDLENAMAGIKQSAERETHALQERLGQLASLLASNEIGHGTVVWYDPHTNEVVIKQGRLRKREAARIPFADASSTYEAVREILAPSAP